MYFVWGEEHFTMKDRREKYSAKQKLAAITLFRKGLSLRSIAEVIGANNVIVLYIDNHSFAKTMSLFSG